MPSPSDVRRRRNRKETSLAALRANVNGSSSPKASSGVGNVPILLLLVFLSVGSLYVFVHSSCFRWLTGFRSTSASAGTSDALAKLPWWKTSIVYQICPRSFQDSDDDGTGDLRGIAARAGYLAELGIGAVWLGPFYESPMSHFGHNVSVDGTFGDVHEWRHLVHALHAKNIKLIVDFVPNHTSDRHFWFRQSRKGGPANRFRDFYVWHPGRPAAGGRLPPNNWVSVPGGSMWTWDERRQQFYLHQFSPEQPDLNFRNQQVREEIESALSFWLRLGVDGFRAAAVKHIFESKHLNRNEPLSGLPGSTKNQYVHLAHPLTTHQDEVHQISREWRALMDRFGEEHAKQIFFVSDVLDEFSSVLPYYESGADFPFNFALQRLNSSCNGFCFRKLINDALRHLPKGKWPNWVLGSHDVGRVAGKFGVKLASSLNCLLLLLPGTPTTYYGEEIALPDIQLISEETRDPHGQNFRSDEYGKLSRDAARSRAPMQWDDSMHAGFSAAPNKTWLPVHPDYKIQNVKSQQANATSPLSFYQKLASLRRSEVFVLGNFDFSFVDAQVVSFVRFIKLKIAYLIALNLSASPRTVDMRRSSGTFQSRRKYLPHSGYVELCSDGLRENGEKVALDKLTIGAHQSLVVRFWPTA